MKRIRPEDENPKKLGFYHVEFNDHTYGICHFNGREWRQGINHWFKSEAEEVLDWCKEYYQLHNTDPTPFQIRCKLEETIDREPKQRDCIWNERLHSSERDRIGFFEMDKARIILNHLNDGKVLLLDHVVYGEVRVYMNSQRNRILVEDHKYFNEVNIMNFIVWNAGSWYIEW